MSKKFKFNKGLIPKLIVIGIFLALVIIAIISDKVLTGTAFGDFVNNTIGKFFNIIDILKNHWITIAESIVIIVFFWLLNKLFEYILLPLGKKRNKHSTWWVLFRSIFKYLSSAVAIFLVLSAWGVDTPTLLIGAGIVGLAISFGAQSLIEDVIAGLFIIFEKQFKIGDVIQVGETRGYVIDIGIRTTSIEDVYGDILIVNNSDLRMILNTSANLSPAISEIYISYDQPLENVENIVKKALPTLKERIPDIIEGPSYRGVQKLDSNGVLIRVYAKVEDLKKFQVVRDMNRELKLVFEKNNIKFGFPTVNVNEREEEVKKAKD